MKIKIGIGFLFLLIGVTAYAFYTAIEFYDETVKQSWTKKALKNPYLAAEQFLTLRGSDVESSNRLKRLDLLPDRGSIFIHDSRQLKKQARLTSLLDWMKKGGHLVVVGHVTRDDSQNLLLDYFGVTMKKADCDCDNKENNKAKDPASKKISELLRDAKEKLEKEKSSEKEESIKKETIPASELTTLSFEGIGGPMQIHFSHTTAISHPLLNDQQGKNYKGPEPFYWKANQAGPQFMQFYVGEGLLSILSDGSIWESGSIDKVDHALLLDILLSSNNKIILLRGMKMPSIFEMLLRYAPELLFSCMAWLLIWILYKVKRFGPIREQNVTSRRSLEEHIMASTGHIWRSKKGRKIIENIHAAIYQKIWRANMGFAALEKNQQVNWISSQCGLTEKEVVIALYSDEVTSEEHFNQIVGLIQKIGNRL